MKEPIFTGTCTAIVTPFLSTGEIDYDTFFALIEQQIAAGIDAICVCGTTGESATLEIEEHVKLVQACVQQVNGRCKVIAGTGSNSTATALYLSQHAQDNGADALLLVTPYYNKTTQAGLIGHYTHIADQIQCPMILYNVPSRTGLSFTANTYQILSQHPRINGTKEASGNFSLIVETRARCGDALNLWSGNDNDAVAMMALGAKGLISVASNLIPDAMIRLTHTFLQGDTATAAAVQMKYDRLIRALFSEVNPIPIKAALYMAGMDSGKTRLPLCQMNESLRQQLYEEMKKADVFTQE